MSLEGNFASALGQLNQEYSALRQQKMDLFWFRGNPHVFLVSLPEAQREKQLRDMDAVVLSAEDRQTLLNRGCKEFSADSSNVPSVYRYDGVNSQDGLTLPMLREVSSKGKAILRGVYYDLC